MTSPSREDSPFARGLRSVERVPGGALLYHVVFGNGGVRRIAQLRISFDDLDGNARERMSRLIWAVVILFHLVLLSIPVLSLSSAQFDTPTPPEGMTVDLVSAPSPQGLPVKMRLAPKSAGVPQREISPRPIDQASDSAQDKGEASIPTSEGDTPSVDSAALSPPPALPAPIVVAPAAQSGATKSAEEVQWEGDILTRIGKRKRYPAMELARGVEDTVVMRLTLNREGRLVRAELARSGGHAGLDTEVLELAKRASPYPRPPSSVPGETVALLVPVEFLIAKRR